ncbi:sigma-70 family RNA polymerase sigma factor [bacterium]|nr:sigma-70 family RNA polymerase sigma factor [bacterium]
MGLKRAWNLKDGKSLVLKNWLKPLKTSPEPSSSGHTGTEELNRNFGDLVYDLYYSTLWNHKGARSLYLTLWRKIDRELKASPETYQKYSRPWILQSAVDLLIQAAPKIGRTLSPSEQVMLDANLNIPARLRQFESYLHKLSISDQILLLFRDKYGLPYSEVAAILRIPEGALRIRHQQALRSLEEWLWDRI